MKKKILTATLAGILTISMSMTALAGWEQEGTNWKYNDNGTYATNGWKWIDGNNDGTAESYYFDSTGVLLANTTTPDGYTVNADGAWTVNGVVQTKQVGANTGVNHGANYDPAHPLAGKIDDWNLRLKETNWETGEMGTTNVIYSWNVQAMLTNQMDKYTGFKENEQAIYDWFCNWLNSFDFQNMTEMERAKEIEKVFAQTHYDYEYYESDHSAPNRGIYAVLIDKKGICSEYASTTITLAKALGLKYSVDMRPDHDWAYIQIDGRGYEVGNSHFYWVPITTPMYWFN